jgi:D-alanine-D-alanine ligase
MKIGLTYDLRSEYLAMGYSKEETAELDKEETIAGIEHALQFLGYKTERIGHVQQLMQRLLKGEKWDLVFNICEGIYGSGRESLVPALLDAFRIPYTFSPPATLALSLDKAACKRVVRDAGIPTPDFCLIRSAEDLDQPKPGFPLFVKPVSEGTGKGINESSMVKEEEKYRGVCTSLLQRFHQPVLVESYLPGREFTAGIVGSGKEARVVGVMEVLFNKNTSEFYSYENKEHYEEKVSYRNITGNLYQKCASLALRVWEITGACDGGRVDLKLNAEGEPEFIEINPLAGLNLHHSDLPILSRLNGISFQELITMIMQAAEKRIFGKPVVTTGVRRANKLLITNE